MTRARFLICLAAVSYFAAVEPNSEAFSRAIRSRTGRSADAPDECCGGQRTETWSHRPAFGLRDTEITLTCLGAGGLTLDIISDERLTNIEVTAYDAQHPNPAELGSGQCKFSQAFQYTPVATVAPIEEETTIAEGSGQSEIIDPPTLPPPRPVEFTQMPIDYDEYFANAVQPRPASRQASSRQFTVTFPRNQLQRCGFQVIAEKGCPASSAEQFTIESIGFIRVKENFHVDGVIEIVSRNDVQASCHSFVNQPEGDDGVTADVKSGEVAVCRQASFGLSTEIAQEYLEVKIDQIDHPLNDVFVKWRLDNVLYESNAVINDGTPTDVFDALGGTVQPDNHGLNAAGGHYLLSSDVFGADSNPIDVTANVGFCLTKAHENNADVQICSSDSSRVVCPV